ncbi:PAS domain S-box protein [Oculatella sp. LEGE 06141]|uniref:PAS domain S-box protein n=1 Tax=Oculatella sp. LEGE 06141 TaxID=1828648 RepID=UPI001881E9C9|nr:PAS domain S-box protein [Oculatella sp. LEGE 06141]MBE9180485.1 PAS domain S-box protein [Oculatella sp. LEGE 06141]
MTFASALENMVFDLDGLQALRECCRDEAAFIKLQQLLAAKQSKQQPTPGGSHQPDDQVALLHLADTERVAVQDSERSSHPNLLRGVAEATSQLLNGDYTQAIQRSIATLGAVTEVDRVYIFETHPHPETGEPAASQRFEWVRDAVSPQIDNPTLQNRTYAVSGLTRWYDIFHAGQPFSSLVRDLPLREQAGLVVQEIRSILIVPIQIDGHLWGVIGFDDCHRERQWSADEKAALQLMAGSIGGAIARYQAERALHHSQSRLQTIAANVPGMLYQFLSRDGDTRQVLYASSGSQELLELDPETIQADFSRISNLCHPDDRASFEAAIDESAATLEPWHWEGRIITPSGKLKWVQGFSRPERQPDGSILWDGVIVDITVSKRAEAASRQNEARYRAMLDASPDLMFRLSREGQYLDFKGNATVHIASEEIIGRFMHELLPPDVAELCWQAMQRTLDTGELQTCKYQLSEPRGIRSYEARLVVCGADEVLSIVQDVTDRNQMEAELRDSKNRLQSFFEATFEAVIVHDFGKVLDVNPAAEKLFGYSTDEIIGMPVMDLVAAVSREQVRQTWRSLESPDQPYDYEGIGVKKDGTTFMGAVCAKAVHYKGQLVRVAGVRDITDSKQAEAAIRQSEARNRALVNAIPDLMFRIRRDGTYLDCKAEHDGDVLLPPLELIGKNVYDVLPLDLAQQRMYYIEQALQTGKTQYFEYQLRLNRNPALDQIYQQVSHEAVLASGHHSRDYEARIVVSGEDEVLAIVRDITDRKLSEIALRLSEEKFSKAFRSSPNPMTITTLVDGRLIEVNDSFLKFSGYSRDEVIDRSVYDINLWLNDGDRLTIIEPLRQHGSVSNVECHFRVKSGEMRVALFSAEVIKIGDELCMLDITVDITERKRAEQQLQAAADRDRLLREIALRIRQSLDLDQILNTTVAEVRQFLHADRVFITQFDPQGEGRVVAESVDSRYPSVLEWVLDGQMYEELQQALCELEHINISDTTQIELRESVREGFIRFQIRATMGVPVMKDERLFGILVAHQCSHSRQWEPFEIQLLEQLATQVAIAIQQAQLYRQVQELNAGLEQLVEERTAQLQQKMEELQELNELKDEFLNAFSHDLRTPMMGMSLVLKNLLNQSGDTLTMTRPIVERMIQSSDHQLNLIRSLLQAHSSETRGVILNYELVQLSLLTQVIVEDLEPLVEKNQATLVNSVPPDLPLVTADPVQLRRVFENLMTNALHHNPPGVALTLSATVEAEMIRFTLHDNGVGMSQEVSDRLFERYVRGPKSRHRGMGLGLYLCRQIITAHGGQIGVVSEPGNGSTFWLTLPLAIPSAVSSSPDASDEA